MDGRWLAADPNREPVHRRARVSAEDVSSMPSRRAPSARVKSRETCICDWPTRWAISTWLIDSKKRTARAG